MQRKDQLVIYRTFFFFLTVCVSVRSSVSRNNYKITGEERKKTKQFPALHFDAICSSFYLWHHLRFCLTSSAYCLTRDQFDWLQRTYTGVGLIWSKLRASGWVVVLWPCLCWMSTPCLSREQPTGIPQIWHSSARSRRKREEGRREKKKPSPRILAEYITEK